MTYTELVAAIEAYTENNFPDITLSDDSTETTKEQIDRFIQQAEQRIYNTIQFPSLRKNVTGSCTSGNKYLQCPLDFLAPYSLAVIDASTGAYTYLLNKDVNFMREAYPKSSTATGEPKYYAYFDNNSFILGPTPDLAYVIELHYGY